MGNIGSVLNALQYLSLECRVTAWAADIISSGKLILPGVGSYRAAMENLNRLGLIEPLNKAVLQKRTPLLGICLGMQLLATTGEEDGLTSGLGWIPGAVKRIVLDDPALKVPHVGFNTTRFAKEDDPLFRGLGRQADFYFVHSYSMHCNDVADVTSWVTYGKRIVASVQRNNIYGMQFHPEKSQTNGLCMLINFSQL